MMAQSLRRLLSPPKHVFVFGANLFVNAATDSAVAAGMPFSIIRTERLPVFKVLAKALPQTERHVDKQWLRSPVD
jgi:hypothetical protein